MRNICLMLVVLLTPAIAAAQDVISKTEFTAKFIEQARASVPSTEYTIVADLQITSDDKNGYQSHIHLGSSYDTYLAGDRDLELVILDRVATEKTIRHAFENKKVTTILPVIKNVHYINAVKEQMLKAGQSESEVPLYFEKINDDLYLLFVFDTESSMRYVSPADVKNLDLTEQIRDIAAQNITSYFNRVDAKFEALDNEEVGRVIRFKADTNYEASILTALEFIRTDEMNFIGEAVVFVPGRNMVLFADSGDIKSLAKAAHIAQKGFKELGYPISPFGYILREGKWYRL
ncbi:hypothetical protein TUM4261_30920 [Shewanella sp. c952]|uniref:hypothetical protein n=1 Tax=Shewanella sp. c952 TaxID=2815913 RepID=UPI001BBDF74D|nr:hypothetical protein [Shewanella sp. c952]GIU14842.1 hypothetical protein TUM4261_30920 [Shewanella sp. c952]